MSALVSTTDYQRVTGDTATADPTAAIADALKAVDAYCRRRFAYNTYTETLYVYRDGKVYPTNTPLDTVTSPPVAATAIQGAGVYLGVFLPTPAYINSGDWRAAVPPQSTVTYTGGYQPYGTTTGPTDELPEPVMRAVCRIAYLILHPTTLQGLPAGVRSVSLGDLAISGDLTAFEAVDAGITRTLRPYRKRQVRGWQRA